MAEVRLRIGRRVCKLLKRQNLTFLDKDSKLVSRSAYVVAVINSPQLCDIRYDRVGADKRPTGLETPKDNGETNSFGSGNISKWTDSRGLKPKTSALHVSCLGTREKLSGHPGSRSHFRRFIYKKTVCGPPNDYLWQFMSFTRAYSGAQNNGRPEEPLYKSKSGYYDILEVSPSATHAQIKTAYYKQSFIYHPDKNAGSEDAMFQFSLISEAYNVLGNKDLRRKYDRGILSQADLRGSSKPTRGDSAASGQQTRARYSPSTGIYKQNTYDFDDFIKSHYGEQLQREQQLRQRRQEMLKRKEEHFKDMKLGKMMEITIGMMLAVAALIIFSLRADK